MENITPKQDIEQRLEEASFNRETIENRLKNTQAKLNELHELFEEDIEQLKVAQQIENSVRNQLQEYQKTALKDMINLEGFTKLLGESTPFFMRMKDKALGKVKAVKEIIDGSAFDKVWIEERYEDYKQICIEKGQEVKSKEEFEKIAITLRDVGEESSNLNLYELFGKVSAEVGSAKDNVKNVWQTVRLNERFSHVLGKKENDMELLEVKDNVPLIAHVDKKSVLGSWIENRNVKKSTSKTNIEDLHADYLLFVEYLYTPQEVSNLTYSMKNGAFAAALTRHFEDLKQDTVDVEGVQTKRVSLKIKNKN